ncbi:MAG: glycosyltransferase family 92 protein [Verrucomicrobia bacterium]|nr:glycosyltransferase family 92 protein [Verrucomicrobiota bacterium]
MNIFFIYLAFIFWLFSNIFAHEYQLSIACIFQDEAPYLKEWIDYHHRIGVEHFWLYDDTSSDNWEEVLTPYIEQGIVEVFDWSPCREQVKIWPKIQVEAYKDALNRSNGSSKWLALIDTDEFILPMKEKTLTKCLENHFSNAGAVYVSWRIFGTSGVTLQKNESMLRQLTACSKKNHPINCVGKSIVRPECVIIDKIWHVHHFPIKSGCKYVNGRKDKIEVTGETDLSVSFHYDKYLRINHYFFRDESYYLNKKIPRKLNRGIEIEELTSLYDYCHKTEDHTIIKLLP